MPCLRVYYGEKSQLIKTGTFDMKTTLKIRWPSHTKSDWFSEDKVDSYLGITVEHGLSR